MRGIDQFSDRNETFMILKTIGNHCKYIVLVEQIPQQIFSRAVTSGTRGSWEEDQKVAVTSPLSEIFSTRMKMQSSASTSNFSRN